MINYRRAPGPCPYNPPCPNTGCGFKGWTLEVTLRDGTEMWHCQNCGLDWPQELQPGGAPGADRGTMDAIERGPRERIRGPGVKLDTGKLLLYQGLIEYFPEALMEIARVSEAGATAPGHVWGGWRDVPDGYKRYTEALIRHLFDTPALEACMRDTGNSDINVVKLQTERVWLAATVAWNSLCRLQHLIRDYRTSSPQEATSQSRWRQTNE